MFWNKREISIDEFDELSRPLRNKVVNLEENIQELRDELHKTREVMDAYKLHATTLDILVGGKFTWENTKTKSHNLLKLEWKESLQRLYTPDKEDYNKRELAEKLAIRCKEMS